MFCNLTFNNIHAYLLPYIYNIHACLHPYIYNIHARFTTLNVQHIDMFWYLTFHGNVQWNDLFSLNNCCIYVVSTHMIHPKLLILKPTGHQDRTQGLCKSLPAVSQSCQMGTVHRAPGRYFHNKLPFLCDLFPNAQYNWVFRGWLTINMCKK